MSRVLVIGYGNPLRGDDGVGVRLAEALAHEAGPETVLACRQLTPELAEAVSAADWVVFIDAARDVAPGAVSMHPLESAEVDVERLSHACTPAALLALSAALYGRSPRALVVGVGVASTEIGERLSRALADELPSVFRRVRDAVRALARGEPLGGGFSAP